MNQQALRDMVRKLPTPVGGPWAQNEARLREAILAGNVDAFLGWPVVCETMRWTAHSETMESLFGRVVGDNPGRWIPALQEPRVGWASDQEHEAETTSCNTLHQAGHVAAFEAATGLRIEDAGSVVEFGGGYGCMCRLIYALGFGGRYVMYDLPVASALQRYYADAVGLDGQVECTSDTGDLRAMIETLPSPRLFIATWSLSEAPMGARDAIAPLVGGFDAYLIAYQERFGGIDNAAYFERWQRNRPDIRWTRERISNLPGPSYYLLGEK